MSVVWLLVAFLGAGLSVRAQTASSDAGPSCVGGNAQSPIRIEVFSDYQCPACGEFYLETMRSVLAEYADAGKVCVVYREFPLRQHAYARQAARYALAARRLGLRQWAQITDALYTSQDEWAQNGKLETVVAHALTEADMKRLRESLNDPTLEETIESDIALGRAKQVSSTPTLFITAQGKTEKVVGVVQYPILRRYLDNLLRE